MTGMGVSWKSKMVNLIDCLLHQDARRATQGEHRDQRPRLALREPAERSEHDGHRDQPAVHAAHQ